MSVLKFEEFAVHAYSKIVEESIMLYLQSEEGVNALNITPEKEKKLRKELKETSKEIAKEIIDELIAKGAFETRGLTRQQERAIIKRIIEKRVRNA